MKKLCCCLLALMLALASETEAQQPKAFAHWKDLRESIELSTNYDLYLTGENIYLSIQCLLGDSLSTLSKVAYVELIGQNGQAALQRIIYLNEGRYTGEIFIPATLQTGNYALIAYTRWMKNFSSMDVAVRTLSVINPFETLSDELFEEGSVNHPKTFKGQGDNDFKIFLNRDSIPAQDSVYATISIPEEYRDEMFNISVQKIDPWRTRANQIQIQRDSVAIRTSTEPLGIPELKGYILEGIVKGPDLKPWPMATISLTNGSASNELMFTQSNDSGAFRFVLRPDQSNGELSLASFQEQLVFQVHNPFLENYDFLQIPDLKLHSSMKSWLLRRAKQVQVEDAYFNIRYEAIRNTSTTGLLNFLNVKTYSLDDYVRFPRLEDPIMEYIPAIGIKVKNGSKIFFVRNLEFKVERDSTLILLNTIPVSSKTLFEQNPAYIEKIDIYSDPVRISGFEFNGIINFQFYKDKVEHARLPSHFLLNNATPSFKEKEAKGRLPDFRNQLLWMPFTRLNSDSTQVSFKTSLNTGVYKISVSTDSKKTKQWDSARFTVMEQ